MSKLTVLELCAGAGGQALGFEKAGYAHVGLLEIDKDARRTLKFNRPTWNVIEGDSNGDIHLFDGSPYAGITDVLAAGLPCPPWSKAGRQLGESDERNLFPAALRIIRQVRPKAILIENVTGITDDKFKGFRETFAAEIELLGYHTFDWQVLNACDFGVPQLRPRAAFVAVPRGWKDHFAPPVVKATAPTVGESLFGLMSERGWPGAARWRSKANSIAPTLVGGSKKHGGPDLGPTRAKRQWKDLSVNGHLVAEEAPGPDFPVDADPYLTVRMAARIQGFDEGWQFSGRKTSAYRQVGNAFPPPVAEALARAIADCLRKGQELNPEGGTLHEQPALRVDGAGLDGQPDKTSPIGEYASNPLDGYAAGAGSAEDGSCDGFSV
jgi:DNA (cytosine-5)-methyltransferase 1